MSTFNKLRIGVNTCKKLSLLKNGNNINNKSNIFSVSSSKTVINNNNKSNNNINRFYSKESPTPLPIPPIEKKGFYRFVSIFTDFSVDKGNGTIGNVLLNIAGFTIILTSIGSLVFYFLDDENKTTRDEYLFRLLSYFSSNPPFDLMEKKGYIKDLVNQYKEGTISPAGLKVIGLIIALGGHDYLLKHGMFDIVCEKLISKKDVLIPRQDPDFFILYRLAFHSPKPIPHEIIQRTEKDNIFRLLDKKDQVLESLQPEKIEKILKVQKSDLMITVLVAAPILSFLLFRNKISPPLLYKSMKRSAIVSGIVIGAPLINETMNKKLFKNCENFTCHALKSQLPTMAYGALIIFVSYFPYITWALPVASTLLATKSVSLYQILSQQTKLRQSIQNNADLSANNDNKNKKNKMD